MITSAVVRAKFRYGHPGNRRKQIPKILLPKWIVWGGGGATLRGKRMSPVFKTHFSFKIPKGNKDVLKEMAPQSKHYKK